MQKRKFKRIEFFPTPNPPPRLLIFEIFSNPPTIPTPPSIRGQRVEESKHPFNVICLTETWLNDHEFKTNSNYHLPNYEGIYYERKTNKRGSGVLMYIRNDLSYKIRNDLCTSDGDREILTIELLTKSTKNIIVSCCYKPPDGNWKNQWDDLQKILTNATMDNIFTNCIFDTSLKKE